MLDKLSARERNLLVVLLGVVLICIVYFGIGKYLYPQFRQVKENLNFKRQELMEVSSRISNLSMLEKENNELKIKLQNLTNSFNKEVRNGVNYYYIGKHAGENGVTVREMKPLPYEDNEEFIKIPLDLTVRGEYQQIIKFIELVEKDMPNTSEITSLEIYPAGMPRPDLPKVEETEKAGSLTFILPIAVTCPNTLIPASRSKALATAPAATLAAVSLALDLSKIFLISP